MPNNSEDDEQEAGTPAWMVTYGDMVTLLLTFFIMMAAFSVLKTPHREEQIIESILLEFGSSKNLELYRNKVALASQPSKGKTTPTVDRDPENPHSSEAGQNPIPGKARPVQVIHPDNKRVVIGGSVFFESGKHELSEEMKEWVRKIIRPFINKRGIIEIRAYKPPAGLPVSAESGSDPFSSAYELAYDRARAIRTFLMDEVLDSAQGEDSAGRIRISVAAPVEQEAVTERAENELELQVVDITILEATKFQPGISTVPTTGR